MSNSFRLLLHVLVVVQIPVKIELAELLCHTVPAWLMVKLIFGSSLVAKESLCAPTVAPTLSGCWFAQHLFPPSSHVLWVTVLLAISEWLMASFNFVSSLAARVGGLQLLVPTIGGWRDEARARQVVVRTQWSRC